MHENVFDSIFDRYMDFSTRSRRSSFTYFNIVYLILYMLGYFISQSSNLEWIKYIIPVILFIPSQAIGVRRFHDSGISGWWYLIGFLMYYVSAWVFLSDFRYIYLESVTLSKLPASLYAFSVLSILLFIGLLRDSEKGTNDWGISPKYSNFNIDNREDLWKPNYPKFRNSGRSKTLTERWNDQWR